jgi:hypothetical protein
MDCMNPGRPPAITVVNVRVACTVTVTTRWPPPGQLVATGVVQSLADGLVAENTPASEAHWHNREALAVTPDILVAPWAVAIMVAKSPLRFGVKDPYWAPARAALVSDIEV